MLQQTNQNATERDEEMRLQMIARRNAATYGFIMNQERRRKQVALQRALQAFSIKTRVSC